MADVTTAVADACREQVESALPVPGGDICQAFRVTLAGGRTVFAKTFSGLPEMFDAEARAWPGWRTQARPFHAFSASVTTFWC